MSLGSCQSELSSIITELQSIRDGIQRDCSGIGQEHCVQCIDNVIAKYQGMLSRLYSVNPNRLADWFLEKMGLKEEDA